jgi:hypothetical protein
MGHGKRSVGKPTPAEIQTRNQSASKDLTFSLLNSGLSWRIESEKPGSSREPSTLADIDLT